MMRKIALLTACMLIAMCQLWAQTKPITGKVVDSVGQPMEGVTVSVKGDSKLKTLTDAGGVFKLTVPGSAQTLIFSYVGHIDKTAAIGNRSVINVSLELSDSKLDDVVVTGFQRIDKAKFGGAAVSLKADQVKIDGMSDVSRMLEGRVAGVAIQNPSGTFGAAPKVRVRGATSLNGANKPLWVIDGVVLEDIVNISNDQLTSGDPSTLLGSPVAGLNPNDIESFDILKDASAAALYGARAMNGVIVITTKKGKSGKANINYVGNYSSQLKPSYNNYNIMNSAEQMSVLAQLERDGLMTSNVASRANNAMYGKMYNMLVGDDNGNFPLENTPEARRDFLLRYAKANTDWFDVLFRNSFIQEHSLSVTFGTEKSQSYFSTSFLNDNGWTIGDKVKRYTLNFRNNYKFSDKVQAGFSTLSSVRQQRAPGTVTRRSNPVEGKYDRDFDINPFSYALNTSRAITPYDENGNKEYFIRNFAPFNIIDELANNYMDINMVDIRLQGDLSYKFAKNFRYDFLGAMRMVKTGREHQITERANMANAYRAAGNATIREANNFLYRDPENPEAEKVVVLPRGGFYNRTEDDLTFYNIRNSVNYNNTFASKHTVDVLVGQEIKFTNRKSANNTGYGYQYEQGGIPFLDYRILKQTIENNFPYYGMSQNFERFAAFYGTAGYSFDKKYNVSFYGRYDGSNKFGKAALNRWLPTWSVSGAWNFDKENFTEDWNWLDFGKLRASYGVNGDMGPATNADVLFRNYITNRPYQDERESAIDLASLANRELSWEKMKSTNVGLEIGILRGKLAATIDWFSRKSEDLIDRISTSGIGGQFYKYANYANLSSNGWDVSLDANVFRNRDWSINLKATFGYAKTKITSLNNQPLIFDMIGADGANQVGYPVRSLFSIQYAGLRPADGVPTFINEKGENATDVYFQDNDISHLKYEGPVDPPYTSGLGATVKYKNLTLNVLVTSQAGNKIRLAPAFSSSYSDWTALPRDFNDRWVQGGEELITNVPAVLDALYRNANIGYAYNVYNYSDVRVAKGDFVRLKSVTLNYSLLSDFIKKAGFTNASVSATAINPWLIYADKKLRGQDPEFFNTGGVAQPLQKQVVLSLKLGL
jgi:TonB-linked SusC/RagA family outer membrane protein